jgi:hypothetical protein
VWKSKFYGTFVLNHRVVSTPSTRRGWFPHSSRLERPALRGLSGPSFGFLKLNSNIREIGSVDHDKLWTAARGREAARIYIPGLGGFWRQREVRERGIQLGFGLLFVDLPFFLFLLELAFMLGLLFALKIL